MEKYFKKTPSKLWREAPENFLFLEGKSGAKRPKIVSYLYPDLTIAQVFKKIGPRRNFGLAETLWGVINSNWLVP